MRGPIAVVALFLAAACIEPDPMRPARSADASDLRVVHDDARRVTCWIHTTAYGAGLSCLPDSALATKETP